jgi:hypothetical protein
MIKSTKNTSSSLKDGLSNGRNATENINHSEQPFDDKDISLIGQLKRRKFLGMGLLGMAGLSLPYGASAGGNNAVEDFVKGIIAEETELYKKQSDTFETKIKLIEKAWAEKDYRMVRSLSDSIRNTGIQAQIEDEDPGKPLVGSGQFGIVATLPAAWKTWANGWKYYKVVGLEEKIGTPRKAEPGEVLLSFQAAQTASLTREIRVAEIKDGVLTEVISQVFSEVRRGAEKLCKLLFLMELSRIQFFYHYN